MLDIFRKRRMWRPRAELGHVSLIRLNHVPDHLVQIASTAARTLAQLETLRRLRGAIERVPACLEDPR